MNTSLILAIAIPALAFVAFLIIVGMTLARLYKRSTREISLVRTGAGGRRVVIDGGCLVIPLLHEVTPINMQTMRLEVRRAGENSLITKDMMRVDMAVEFYVAVESTIEGIARAAQTLGRKTFNVAEIMTMIEGKLVGGLRSVSAQMSMQELHEQRSVFVQEVQKAVSEDLLKNGLLLESVSLTTFDQTPLDRLDPKNVFTATANKLLAVAVAESATAVAKINTERDTAIRLSEQTAALRKLEIEQTQEEARVRQSIEVSAMRANEASEQARLAEDSARLRAEAEIAREKAVTSARILKDKDLEIAEQERKIAVAVRSEEESRARGQADAARAVAILQEAEIETNRKVAETERNKRIVIIQAEESAERDATVIRVRAKAERDASTDQAEGLIQLAQARAKEITIIAEAGKVAKLAEADGINAIILAENGTNANVFDYKLSIARIEALPGIIAEMVKPAEKIDSIRIHNVSGLNGALQGPDGTAAQPGSGNMVEQAFRSIQEMTVALPALKMLGDSVGLSMSDGIVGLVGGEFSPSVAAPAPASPRTAPAVPGKSAA